MSSSPLGRGLGSLIPLQAKPTVDASTNTTDVEHREIHRVPLAKIRPNPKQPRSTIGHEGLEELIESVREHGVIQPLIVTPKGQEYELIAGERRYQASKIVGLKTLPVIIRDVTEQQQLELGLVENLQREDLNPLEEADAYQRLVDEFNMTQEQVAKRVGKSRSYVANTLRLRSLPEEIKKAVLGKKLSEGHAKVLLSIENAAAQLEAFRSILAHGMSVRASEAFVATKRPPSTRKKSAGSADIELRAHEEMLQKALGTKVSIARSGEQGAITIRFFSHEELTALIQKLTDWSL